MPLEDIGKNIIIETDAYNLSHEKLKINTDWESSHIYNRGKPMILHGLNESINKQFEKPITYDDIAEAEELYELHNVEWTCKHRFEKIVEKYGGYPPIKIDALPDGTYVPANTPFMQITNTVEGFGECVSWWESEFLPAVFFASGCATEAFRLRQYLEEKKCNKYKFHSFAARSYNSKLDKYWGTTAWCLFLFGIDDCVAFKYCKNAPTTSIAASAHKVVQQFDRELDAYTYAIEQMAGKPVSIPIDTYNPDRFIEKYQEELMRLAMKLKTMVVFRPDSGDVKDQARRIMEKIMKINNPKQFNVIIGEGMGREKCIEFDRYFESLGFDINKFVYGIGGRFHRHIDRDYIGAAMKTSYSNKRPRMKRSADIAKMSLPDVINLYYEDNVLVCDDVGFNITDARIVTTPQIRPTAFKTIYLNNEWNINYRFKETWDDIYARVNQINYNAPLQEAIVYTPAMQAMITKTKEFIDSI